MKINYILDSSFPTEKAYGVTTENTINSLIDLKHEVNLFCHSPNKLLEHKISKSQITYFKYSGLNKFLRRISLSGYGKFFVAVWNLSRFLTLIENRQKFKIEDCEVIWTRDNPLPYYLKKYFTGVEVVEIHKIPSERTIGLLSKLDPKKVVICPISKSIEAHLINKLPDNRILWSPMGVTRENRSKNEMVMEIERHYGSPRKYLTIGYFGKLAPSGVSKGFEDILDLSLELSGRKVGYKILFIGIRDSELKMLLEEIERRGINQDKILIQTHLPHEKSLKLMRNCDFLVLPANRDPKYFGFPLKALEYVTALRMVIAGDTQANREVFVDKFQPFWYEKHDISKLADLVTELPKLEFLRKYLVTGYRYAEQFTWANRTKKILNSMHDISII